MKTRAYEVLGFCLDKVAELTEKPLSVEADRAYVYIDERYPERYSWVILSHGPLGTFQKINTDTWVVFSCGMLNGPPMKIVFLAAPLKDALIDDLSQAYVDSPEGATEILFKRKGKKFEYCCSQPFDENNFYKHNPDFHWNPNRVGS